MNILLLGNGGREHALAYRLRKSASTDRLFIAPGNPGTASLGTNLPISVMNAQGILDAVHEHQIGLVIIGPEQPLAEGLADFLRAEGIPVCGPGRDGAILESSKAFSKAFMEKYHIPTARYRSFNAQEAHSCEAYLQQHPLPVVVKASGLAAGKGVVICNDRGEAIREVRNMLNGSAFGESGETVVIEEFLSGIEVSVFILTDGSRYVLLPEAKDYKRIGEGDTGPNTGGMGAISPVPFFEGEFRRKCISRIIEPTLEGLKAEGIDYRGFIFFGLINVQGEPQVIEYNCRMGDPETEAVMLRLGGDFALACLEAAHGTLQTTSLPISAEHCATVMLVSGGYPGAYEKGKEISLPTLPDDIQLLHAGTRLHEGKLLTDGGRVLAISCLNNNPAEALTQSLKVAEQVKFEGKYFRRDIGKDLEVIR